MNIDEFCEGFLKDEYVIVFDKDMNYKLLCDELDEKLNLVHPISWHGCKNFAEYVKRFGFEEPTRKNVGRSAIFYDQNLRSLNGYPESFDDEKSGYVVRKNRINAKIINAYEISIDSNKLHEDLNTILMSA